jgi:hypothetical protein
MSDAAAWAPVVLLAITVLWRLPAARAHYGQRMLCCALTAVGLAMALNTDQIYLWVDGLLGIRNVANLGEHVLGVIGVSFLLEAVRAAVGAGTGKWANVLLPGAVIVALTICFIVAPLPVVTTDFTQTYGHLPSIGVYWALTLAYIGVAMFRLGQMAWSHGRSTARPAVRRSMQVVTVGCGVALTWVLLKLSEDLGELFDAPTGIIDVIGGLENWMLNAAVIILSVGSIIPPVQASAERLRWRWRRTALIRRIEPLWKVLVQECPQVVLPSDGERWHKRPVDARLYRMVIESRDAMLILRARDAPRRPAHESGEVSDGPVALALWAAASVAVSESGASSADPSLFGANPLSSGQESYEADAVLLVKTADLWRTLSSRDPAEPVAAG